MHRSTGNGETKGLVAMIEAADAMVRPRMVTLVGYERSAPDLSPPIVRGDVAAVKAARRRGSSRAASWRTGQRSRNSAPHGSVDDAIADQRTVASMIIARILGTVVASKQTSGCKEKTAHRPSDHVDGTATSGYVVAVDTVGARLS